MFVCLPACLIFFFRRSAQNCLSMEEFFDDTTIMAVRVSPVQTKAVTLQVQLFYRPAPCPTLPARKKERKIRGYFKPQKWLKHPLFKSQFTRCSRIHKDSLIHYFQEKGMSYVKIEHDFRSCRMSCHYYDQICSSISFSA